MAKVAQQMVEQSGINVNELLDKLVRAAVGSYNLLLHDSAGQRHWRVRDSKKSLRMPDWKTATTSRR